MNRIKWKFVGLTMMVCISIYVVCRLLADALLGGAHEASFFAGGATALSMISSVRWLEGRYDPHDADEG